MKDLITSLYSSSISALLTLCAVHPLDVYKNSIQLKETQTLKNLYRGFSSSLCRELTYTTLRIGLYSPSKKFFNVGEHSSLMDKFFVGSFTGTVATIISNPFDICKIRAMSNTFYKEPKNVLFVLSDIIKNGGIYSLYKGLSINCLRSSILNGVKLSTYDYNKKLLKNDFLAAFLTGLYVSVVITPFDYVRTQTMISSNSIINIDMRRLYSGFFPLWMRFAPSSVLQLLIYDKMMSLHKK